MKILALEPYYGGSHRAFLDGWCAGSRHEWTVYSLPPGHWKWRMRHAAITFAERAAQAVKNGDAWDMLFCSDMLNFAEFRGLCPPAIGRLPGVAYFHENQLTYPVLHAKEYDYHFAFSNMTTALAAQSAWFNSAYHRDTFLDALRAFLKRMPDHQLVGSVDDIAERSVVRYPGVTPIEPRVRRAPGPLHILWAARWEYDKGPARFFAAVDRLAAQGTDFRLSVIGGRPTRNAPSVFAEAADRHASRIVRWGFQPTRNDYEQALRAADVVVSTAEHEFFGISVVEAMLAGVYPLVPRRLAYPEVLSEDDLDECFYDTDEELPARLGDLARRITAENMWSGDPHRGVRCARKYLWTNIMRALDDRIEESLTFPKAQR